MISRILIILGALCTLLSVLGLISLILLPIKERFEIVYDREYDYIRSRLDPKIRKHVWHEKRHLTRDFIIAFIIGFIMVISGLYLGFATEGDGFWFYDKFYPESATNQVWDNINEDNQYVSEEGKEYSYYILISGSELSLSGQMCEDVSELKEKLVSIRRENTVIIIDDFAISKVYHAVERTLNEIGIKYEVTQ